MLKRSTFAHVAIAATLAFSVAACSDSATSPETLGDNVAAPSFAVVANDDAIQNMMARVNAKLAADGANYILAVVEYLTAGDSEAQGRTVIFSGLGNKQLGHHWVPGDARRTWGGPGTSISFINDLADGATASGLTAVQTNAAIQNAMQTWQDVTCSTIPLFNFGSFNFDFGLVQFIFGFGGVNGVAADITHAGWLPGPFFDASIFPGASAFVLGVTFTLIFIDPTQPGSPPTDIDNNGKLDTALREIYYNDDFDWVIDQNVPGVPDFDVETVAMHEAGHGLSQAHFGTAFFDAGLGQLHFSPRAAMNAAYSGIQQDVTMTDNAGHCSIWAQWPNS